MARLVFLGSPPAAVPSLRALVDAGHDVALVVSRADTRRGRGGGASPSAVKQAALELGLAVTDRLDDAVQIGAELGVVVAYGRIVPTRVLDALAMINVHFSLLPRWRGAAPVERAVLAGDDVTGVCVMRLEAGLDTGPVLASRRVDMAPGEHADALRARLAEIGAALLVETLAPGAAALGPGTPQEGEPTYAPKLGVEDLRLDWDRPAVELDRVVRLDRAWTTVHGRRLLVLEALARADAGPADTGPADPVPAGAGAPPGTVTRVGSATLVSTGAGALELLRVQPEGRRPMDAADWVRGWRTGSIRLGTAGADR